jgi:hypothetical protein
MGSVTLSDATALGVWSSSNAGVASVSGAGVVTGASVGSANISYSVTDINGCVGSAVLPFSVSNPVTAVITPAGPTTFCTGGSVVLNAPSGVGLAYQWSIGGSPISGATSSSHTATLAGSYTVVVTSGACVSTSAPVVTTIMPVAVAPITGAGPVCVGQTIALSDADGGGTWTSGTVSVATVSGSGVVTGVAAGTTIISYSAVATCGLASTTVAIVVNPLPVVAAISGPSAVCLGGTVTLSDATASGVWSSSNPPLASVSVTGNVTGLLTGGASISYTVTDVNGCVGYATLPFSVSTPVAAVITPAGPTTFCPGGSVVLDAPSGGGLLYQWSIGGSPISGATASSYNASLAGNYTVVVTSGACVSTSSSVTVTITPPVVASITGPASVCVGQNIALSDADGGGTWVSGTPSVATVSTSGVVSGVAGGSTVITYTATVTCGVASTTKTITVNALPVVSSILGSSTVCMASTVALSDATPSGIWTSVNTGVATITPLGVVSGVSVGSSVISYTVTNGFGCVAAATMTMNVIPTVTAVITPAGPTTFCTGGYVLLSAGTGTGLSYQWKLGGVNITGATMSTYTTSVSGNYTVGVTGGGCSVTSAPVTVTVNPAPIVVPSVSIAASPGTILCVTPSPVTFTATPTNGGSFPAYQWSVNGTPVAGGPSFLFTPASGDVVLCQLTSSDICAFPATATTADTMLISPLQTPVVSISVAPNDTVCKGSNESFIAVRRSVPDQLIHLLRWRATLLYVQ